MSQPPPQYPPGGPPSGGVPSGGWEQPPGGQPPGGTPPGGWGPGSGGYGAGPPAGPPGRSKAPLIIVLAVVAVVLVGGGVYLLTQGEERSEEEEQYIDAITASAEANEDQDSEEALSEEENRCLAIAAVDTVGLERIREVGTPEEIRNTDGDPLESIELNLEQAGAFYDEADGCVDFRQVLLNDLESSGLTSEQIECVDQNLGDDLLRDLLVAQFADDTDASSEAGQAVEEATSSCNLPGG